MTVGSTDLTSPQRNLLRRGLYEGYDFVILLGPSDDRVAQNLSAKGLGNYRSFAGNYPWRQRSGYINHFYPNEKGLEMMEDLAGQSA